MTLLDADASQVVEWPARELSLRQFVEALETQTDLRHRFLSCGNGYSLLKGPDCGFGMILRNPAPRLPAS
jgi:hypothetical protein